MLAAHKRLFIFLIVIILLSGVGVCGYLLAMDEPRIVDKDAQETDVAAGADNARILPSATVSWEYEYEMCSHHIYIQCQVDENMIGLTFTEFQLQYPDVHILQFSPEEIVLKMSFKCYCPDHYILRRYKDELAIYRTILGTDDQEIYLNLPIRFDDINGNEKQALETGKLFDSLEELESYLESAET